MANAQLDYVLQAFTIYIDGYGKAGSGEKCKLPPLKKKTEDFRGGGMLAARKVALGYEAPELELEFSSFDPQILAQSQLFTRMGVPLSIRSYLNGDQDREYTVIIQARGECMEIDAGTWEPGKKALLKAKFALDAYKLVIADKIIFDMDIQAGKYDGVNGDVGAKIRGALGF